MTRRVLWVGTVVAVALLAISAGPVSAANVTIVSDHDTFGTGSQGEPSPTTLANMSVSGSGDSAQVVSFGEKRSFEDQLADSGVPDGWENVGSPDSQAVTHVAIDGSQSHGAQYTGAGNLFTAPDNQPLSSTRTDQNVSVWVYNQQSSSSVTQAGLQVRESGTALASPKMQDGDLVYYDGSDLNTISTTPDYGEWVKITITSVDPVADTFDVHWATASGDSGTASDLALQNSASNGWDQAGVVTYGDADQFHDAYQLGSGGGGQYLGAGHAVTDPDTGFANVSTVSDADVTLEWQQSTDGGSSWSAVTSQTVSSSGNYTANLSSASGDVQIRLNLTFVSTGESTDVKLEREGVLAPTEAPSGSNADPTGEVANYDGDVSLDVSDPDFGDSEGDEVNVSVSNQSGYLGSTTVTENGTVSVSYDPIAGLNELEWTLTDEFGNSETVSQTFSTPGILEVRKERGDHELVSSAGNLSVTFYSGNEVLTREITDGTANLSGVPADERIVVQVDADGYNERRVVIRSLFEQTTVYLLDTNATTNDVRFELTDPTGEFPPEETVLYIEKPITTNGTTEYQTLVADEFGATASVTAILEDGARYRLRVRSGGQERILGSYTAQSSGIEELQIERIEPRANDQKSGTVYGSLETTGNESQVAVRFRGGDNETEVRYNVTGPNGTAYVPNTTVTGQKFAHIYSFNVTNLSFPLTVAWSITTPEGETRSGEFRLGGVSGPVDRFDVDPQVMSIVSWLLILMTIGLVVVLDETLAPAAGTGMASMLTILGTVAIPAPILGVAGAVSALALFGGRT